MSSKRRGPRPSDEAQSAADAKSARRAQRKREEAMARQRDARWRRVRMVGLMAFVGGGLVAGAFVLLQPDPEVSGVERPRDLGGGHVANATYASPTPTSGPHPAQAPSCGASSSPLDPGLAVHALEHGAVVVYYRAADAATLRDPLEALADQFSSHVIVAPHETLDDPIVATAWNRLQRFDAVGGDVREFIDVYRRRGPERVDCDS